VIGIITIGIRARLLYWVNLKIISKADFDRTIVDLSSRIEAVQAEAKDELHHTNVQLHNITQAIIDQMTESREVVAKLNQRYSQLEARLDDRSSSSPESPQSQFILTNNKRTNMLEGGSKQQGEIGPGRNDRYQPPRADCPSFTGDNLVEWVRRYNSYFEIH